MVSEPATLQVIQIDNVTGGTTNKPCATNTDTGTSTSASCLNPTSEMKQEIITGGEEPVSADSVGAGADSILTQPVCRRFTEQLQSLDLRTVDQLTVDRRTVDQCIGTDDIVLGHNQELGTADLGGTRRAVEAENEVSLMYMKEEPYVYVDNPANEEFQSPSRLEFVNDEVLDARAAPTYPAPYPCQADGCTAAYTEQGHLSNHFQIAHKSDTLSKQIKSRPSFEGRKGSSVSSESSLVSSSESSWEEQSFSSSRQEEEEPVSGYSYSCRFKNCSARSESPKSALAHHITVHGDKLFKVGRSAVSPSVTLSHKIAHKSPNNARMSDELCSILRSVPVGSAFAPPPPCPWPGCEAEFSSVGDLAVHIKQDHGGYKNADDGFSRDLKSRSTLEKNIRGITAGTPPRTRKISQTFPVSRQSDRQISKKLTILNQAKGDADVYTQVKSKNGQNAKRKSSSSGTLHSSAKKKSKFR